MPLYDFIDTNTGEQFTKMLKMAEYDQYLADNPHIQTQILSAPKFTRSATGGIKTDDGWKENMSRIAAAHPNSTLADNVGGRDSKTMKVKEIANKHGFGIAKSTTD